MSTGLLWIGKSERLFSHPTLLHHGFDGRPFFGKAFVILHQCSHDGLTLILALIRMDQLRGDDLYNFVFNLLDQLPVGIQLIRVL